MGFYTIIEWRPTTWNDKITDNDDDKHLFYYKLIYIIARWR